MMKFAWTVQTERMVFCAIALVALGSWSLPGSRAAAQPPPPGGYAQPVPAPQQQGMPPQQQAAPPQQQTGGEMQIIEQEEVQGQQAYEPRGGEFGGHLVVPVFLNDNEATAGLGLQARWAFAEVGFGGRDPIALELNVGGFITGVTDMKRNDPDPAFRMDGLSNVWIGLGGRYMFFNPSALVPFVGAGAALNIWTPCDDLGEELLCDIDTGVGIGFNALAGAALELSRWFAIEGGVQWNWSVVPPGGIRDTRKVWLSPFAGVAIYY